MIDPLRHQSVFNPSRWSGTIDIAGCGATGSRVALSLARLGLAGHLRLFDHDVVEPHNLANQLFSAQLLGVNKANAAACEIEAVTSQVADWHSQHYPISPITGRVVFALTDTMSSRKAILAACADPFSACELLIETRMGIDEGRVYAFHPHSSIEHAAYAATLYDDDTATPSACGATTVGPTADILAGLAVWQFIAWFRNEPFDNEIIWGVRPPCVAARTFAASSSTIRS
jgi:hypothetical protein